MSVRESVDLHPEDTGIQLFRNICIRRRSNLPSECSNSLCNEMQEKTWQKISGKIKK